MLGAELGTCADTLLATIRSNRQAIKTGIFHLSFNIISILTGLLCFPLFIKLVLSISRQSAIQQQIATAHITFNVLGVLLFLPFIGLVEKLLNKMIPEKNDDSPEITGQNSTLQKQAVT